MFCGSPFNCCCCLMYKFCLPTVAPPPITLNTSPRGPSITLSYNSSSSLSNFAGDSLTLSFGEERNSSRSTSNLLSRSVMNRFCNSFGSTFDFAISSDSLDLNVRYLSLVFLNLRVIRFLFSSSTVKGGRSILGKKAEGQKDQHAAGGSSVTTELAISSYFDTRVSRRKCLLHCFGFRY